MRISDWSSDVCSSDLLLAPSTAEALLFWSIGSLLIGNRGLRGHPVRTTLFAITTLVFSVLMPAQCYALVYSKSFISVLALEKEAYAHFSADIRQKRSDASAVGASGVMVTLYRSGERRGGEEGGRGCGTWWATV